MSAGTRVTKFGSFGKGLLTQLQQVFLVLNADSQQIFTSRGTSDYAYLINIGDGGGSTSGVMVGRAAQKTYVMNITVNRPTGYGASGDSNDSIFKTSYNNYAVNDANFIMRGYNTTLYGRSPGVGGHMYCASFTNDIRSGATWTTSIPLQVMCDNGGIVSATMYAADFVVRRQGATDPTEEGGIRIRNLTGTGNLGNELDCAIAVQAQTSAGTGFTRLINAQGTNTLKETSSKVTLAAVYCAGAIAYVRVTTGAITVEANEA